MMCENDKLIIPEKFQKMSVSELRYEKEKLYMEIRKDNTSETKQNIIKHDDIIL